MSICNVVEQNGFERSLLERLLNVLLNLVWWNSCSWCDFCSFHLYVTSIEKGENSSRLMSMLFYFNPLFWKFLLDSTITIFSLYICACVCLFGGLLLQTTKDRQIDTQTNAYLSTCRYAAFQTIFFLQIKFARDGKSEKVIVRELITSTNERCLSLN